MVSYNIDGQILEEINYDNKGRNLYEISYYNNGTVREYKGLLFKNSPRIQYRWFKKGNFSPF